MIANAVFHVKVRCKITKGRHEFFKWIETTSRFDRLEKLQEDEEAYSDMVTRLTRRAGVKTKGYKLEIANFICLGAVGLASEGCKCT